MSALWSHRQKSVLEVWTFVYKKQDQLDPIEQLVSLYGDAWVWIAFSPVFKIVPAWLVRKRTLRDAHRLVFRLKSATDGHIPFFTRDELPHYADALLDAYGELKPPPRQGSRGPLPAPRKYPPPDLCYAVVVKERERGRVVNVTTRFVYDAEEQIRMALHNSPVSQVINTDGVERNNLTVRQLIILLFRIAVCVNDYPIRFQLKDCTPPTKNGNQ
jgi:IS1 family transposase